MKYRNELKYLYGWNELEVIKHRLQPLMRPDENAKNGEEFYRIRSMYFDSYTDCCMKENESGIDNRKKIRIRIYNGSNHFIRLEIKHKRNGLTAKESCRLSLEQYNLILSGRMEELQLSEGPLRQLYVAVTTAQMTPKVLVEYERTAFICPDGNVRITLDRNIRASDRIDEFFQEDFHGVPVLEGGIDLLEIKFDEFLPSYIETALGDVNFRRTAFSKYYLSREALRNKSL